MANKKKPAQKLYDWGDGKGRIHTIDKTTHAQNVEAKGYGIDLNAPASAPLSNRGAYGLAQQQAGLQYDPQIQASQQMGANVQPWFQNYTNQVTQAQQAAQAYAQPILDQSKQWATATPTAAPGLDPNSQAAQQSQQAASSGQNLAQLGYTTLAAIPVSANNYFSGLQTVAAGQVPVAQQFYNQQTGQLQGLKGQAVGANYAANRTSEQNAGIAYSTLGLNTQKAADDAAYDAASLGQKQDAADAKGKQPNKYGIPADQWSTWSSSHRQRVIDKFNGDGGAADDAKTKEKEAAKKKAAITKATGKTRVDVDNVINAWKSYVGQTTDDTSKPKDPVTGEYPARKVTPADIKRILQSKGYDAGLVHVALLVRAHKPLDQAAINYLHSKDPNIRIPREWLPPKSKTPAQDANPHATGEPSDRAPGKYGGHI